MSIFFILFIFLYRKFLLVIYFIHISVYMSIPTSQFITPTTTTPTPRFPSLVPICLLATSVSVSTLQTSSSVPFFYSPHICINIWYLFFSFCLLHSVWQSLGPSMSLQMTQFCSFLWLSNIPLYICTTSSLSIPLLMNI